MLAPKIIENRVTMTKNVSELTPFILALNSIFSIHIHFEYGVADMHCVCELRECTRQEECEGDWFSSHVVGVLAFRQQRIINTRSR